MSQRLETKAHLHFRLNESRDGEYNLCCTCGEKTVLIVAPMTWGVDMDQERFSELSDKEYDEMPDSVEVDEEITAHYCLKCEKVTSFSFNQI